MSWIDISWLHLSCLLTDVHSRHKSYCQQVIMIFFWRMHILQNNSLSIATIMELELRRPKKCTNESMLCCCAMYTMWLCIRVLKANNIFFYNVQMTYFTKFFMYNTWKKLLWYSKLAVVGNLRYFFHCMINFNRYQMWLQLFCHSSAVQFLWDNVAQPLRTFHIVII